MKQRKIIEQLKDRQQLLGMTNEDVSAMSGVPKTTLTRMRGGRQYNSYEPMEAYANALGMELVLTFKR